MTKLCVQRISASINKMRIKILIDGVVLLQRDLGLKRKNVLGYRNRNEGESHRYRIAVVGGLARSGRSGRSLAAGEEEKAVRSRTALLPVNVAAKNKGARNDKTLRLGHHKSSRRVANQENNDGLFGGLQAGLSPGNDRHKTKLKAQNCIYIEDHLLIQLRQVYPFIIFVDRIVS